MILDIPYKTGEKERTREKERGEEEVKRYLFSTLTTFETCQITEWLSWSAKL